MSLWSEIETQQLYQLYPTAPRRKIQAALPRRTIKAIHQKAQSLGLKRPVNHTHVDKRVQERANPLPDTPWWISEVVVDLIRQQLREDSTVENYP